MQDERGIVNVVVGDMVKKGFEVVTEVPNFHRSADIAAIDGHGNVWVVECKMSAMGKAIDQTLTHRLSADRVAIATPYRKIRLSTRERLQSNGIGLFYVLPDGSVEEGLEPAALEPWSLARDRLHKRIKELNSC